MSARAKVPTYVVRSARIRAARNAKTHYGEVTNDLNEWYFEACRDGYPAMGFKPLWKVFTRDAEINSSSECYNTFYVTLRRLYDGKGKRQSRTNAVPVRVTAAVRKAERAFRKVAKVEGYKVTISYHKA